MENQIDKIFEENNIFEGEQENFFTAMAEMLQLASDTQRELGRNHLADDLRSASHACSDRETFMETYGS